MLPPLRGLPLMAIALIDSLCSKLLCKEVPLYAHIRNVRKKPWCQGQGEVWEPAMVAVLLSCQVCRKLGFAMTPNVATSQIRPGAAASTTEVPRNWPTLPLSAMPAVSFFLGSLLAFYLCCLFLQTDAHAASAAAATIDDCQYADDNAARAAWEPMQRHRTGFDGAARRPQGPAPGLQLRGHKDRTRLLGPNGERWTCLPAGEFSSRFFAVILRRSLTSASISRAARVGITRSFFPESATGWNTIWINKAATQTEGNPAGWGSIKAIRISAWRGKAVNTEFYLSDIRRIGTIGADAVVAVLRGESAHEASARGSAHLWKDAQTLWPRISTHWISGAPS